MGMTGRVSLAGRRLGDRITNCHLKAFHRRAPPYTMIMRNPGPHRYHSENSPGVFSSVVMTTMHDDRWQIVQHQLEALMQPVTTETYGCCAFASRLMIGEMAWRRTRHEGTRPAAFGADPVPILPSGSHLIFASPRLARSVLAHAVTP
jgi:hypothetical protein